MRSLLRDALMLDRQRKALTEMNEEPIRNSSTSSKPPCEAVLAEHSHIAGAVEAAMLLEVQKVNKAYRDLQVLLTEQIRKEYKKLQ